MKRTKSLMNKKDAMKDKKKKKKSGPGEAVMGIMMGEGGLTRKGGCVVAEAGV